MLCYRETQGHISQRSFISITRDILAHTLRICVVARTKIRVAWSPNESEETQKMTFPSQKWSQWPFSDQWWPQGFPYRFQSESQPCREQEDSLTSLPLNFSHCKSKQQFISYFHFRVKLKGFFYCCCFSSLFFQKWINSYGFAPEHWGTSTVFPLSF